jgi:glycosyltransferase involved in cell wall biosynthesis
LTRVLFLTESFHPVLGGGEQHILRLSRRLLALGARALVVTRQGDPAWSPAESIDGVAVRRVPPPGPGRAGKYRMVPGALLALTRERAHYDLIVVRGTRVLGLPGLLAARCLGKRVVMQAELNGELSGEVYSWGRFAPESLGARALAVLTRLRNLLLRDADGFVAMSSAIAAEFEAAGVPPHKIALIPHGVDTDRFSPAAPGERGELRRRLALGADALIACYTGRLLRGKGLEVLLESVAAAREKDPRWHLLLIGSGAGQSLSVEPELRARAARPDLQAHVSFAGRVEDVSDYLRASDVFAFPSLYEALGLSLVEAAACGLACVGARTGGIVDVIQDGESGLLVEPGSAGALAGALLRPGADAPLRARLGALARARALERFDEARAATAYRAWFAELQGRRPR